MTVWKEGSEVFERQYGNFTTTAPGPVLYFLVSLEFIEVIGSGGRDRTADFGVMNPPLR